MGMRWELTHRQKMISSWPSDKAQLRVAELLLNKSIYPMNGSDMAVQEELA